MTRNVGGLAALAVLLLCSSMVAANPSGYPSGPYGSPVTLTDNTTFVLFMDLQTFNGAQAACQSYAAPKVPPNLGTGNLASVSNAQQWQAITNLTNAFWSDPASIAADYKSAPEDFTLGFDDPTMFEGCVWIGLTNLNPPAAKQSSPESLGSVSFIDGTQTSDFLTDIRNPDPVSIRGWPLYGKSSDKYGTCAMYCPSLTAAQLSAGYSEVMLADCTTVGLPYVCIHMREEPQPEGQTLTEAVLGTTSAAKQPTSGSGDQAISNPTTPGYGRKLLGGGGGGGGGNSGGGRVVYESDAWPIVPEQVPTVLGVNATCMPMGGFSYCSFPESVRLSQADWMYVCWQAGLQPLSIESYAELSLMFTITQPASVSYLMTSSSATAINSELTNIYAPYDFIQQYQQWVPLQNELLSTSYVWSYTAPYFYPITIAPFDNAGSPTLMTPYSYLSVDGAANPVGLTCGPDGYGFGCAAALQIVNGKPTALTSIASNQLSHGMCKKVHTASMPRPPGSVIVEVEFLFKFEMFNTTVAEIFGNYELSAALMADLAKVAVPAALPGMAPADVVIPRDGAVAKFFPVNISEPALGQLGALVVIKTPWTVNTTALVQSYMLNLANSTMQVLPPAFLKKWQIVGATGTVATISGNLDATSSSNRGWVAVVAGLLGGIAGVALGGLIYLGVKKINKGKA